MPRGVKPTLADKATAANIARIRQQQRMSQGELASEIGYTQAYISKIERGEMLVNPIRLLAIAEVLGVSAAELRVDPAQAGPTVITLADGTTVTTDPENQKRIRALLDQQEEDDHQREEWRLYPKQVVQSPAWLRWVEGFNKRQYDAGFDKIVYQPVLAQVEKENAARRARKKTPEELAWDREFAAKQKKRQDDAEARTREIAEKNTAKSLRPKMGRVSETPID